MTTPLADATNPFADTGDARLAPETLLDDSATPAAELLARAFVPRLDIGPRRRLSWGLAQAADAAGDDAAIEGRAGALLRALRQRRGYCSGAQAYELHDCFLDGAELPVHRGRAFYWLRIAADRGHCPAAATALLLAHTGVLPLLAEHPERDALAICLRQLIGSALQCAALAPAAAVDDAGLVLVRVADLASDVPDLLDPAGARAVDIQIRRWLTLPDRNTVHEMVLQMYLDASVPRCDTLAPEPAAPPAAGDCHVACDVGIDSPDLQRRYGALTRPLPLRPAPAAAALQAALDAELPWLASITAKLAGHLALRQAVGRTAFHLPPQLLVGPPGSGKTRYAQRLFELVDLPIRLLGLAGAADNRALQGTARGWNTTQPSVIVQTMVGEGIANPGILLDEIDKVSPSRRNGNAWDTLHLLLEPRSAARWFDECLLVPCDLRPVTFVATANSLAPLPRSLLSRFTLHFVPAPSEADRWAIVTSLLQDVAADLGTEPAGLPRLHPADWSLLLASCGESIRDSKRLLHDLLVRRLAEAVQPAALH